MPLPYHAGKAKLAKTISKMVYKKAEENPSIKNYAEPFSGMARVGIKVMEDDKNKVFKKYIFSDVNPTITVLFKALKKGWLPNTGAITQKKWESYKKNKKPSAQKSFVGYTLGFGGQYLGGSKPCANKHSVKTHSVTDWTEIMLKRKKKYLKGLQPYFKSSKFVYKEKSVFDLDYKDTIIYCDPPYVATAFRAKKIWDKDKENKLWNTIKKWLEPSKNNIVILSNSKRTNKMKGLRVKKIYEDDVEYGSWKKNWKKRKEMIFEVVNSSGKNTRKKKRRKQRGGTKRKHPEGNKDEPPTSKPKSESDQGKRIRIANEVDQEYDRLNRQYDQILQGNLSEEELDVLDIDYQNLQKQITDLKELYSTAAEKKEIMLISGNLKRLAGQCEVRNNRITALRNRIRLAQKVMENDDSLENDDSRGGHRKNKTRKKRERKRKNKTRKK
jgi:site-specific DNA-adenine methylase